ncbi:zinc metalloprotease [Tritrichomonas musculus]|uniref:CAAX prenyl protease n=1 Tax=Tritrichomonas musculus TaxID=1915356 RepID=A0ABR2KAL0_9EUKA
MFVEIAVGCTVFEILFELYLEFRQLNHLKKTTKPVDIFKDTIKEEDFKKSVDYQIDVTKFGILTKIVSTSILTPFIIKYLWDITAYGNEIIHSCLFTTFSSLIDVIISIPFSYYRKFVIEEKYGFNNSTIKLWISDIIKSFLVETIMSSILYSILIFLYNWAGPKFIPIAFVFFFGFVVILQILYPIVIMPLFTKLSEIPEGEIKNSINDLAKETNFNIKEIYQTDDSKRSSKQNAFMMGLFTHKVALADTLIKKCDADEIKAVVGHEIGHSKHRHIWKLIFINQAAFTLTCFLLNVTLKSTRPFVDFGFTDEKPFIIGLIISTLISSPINALLSLPLNMLIRHFEYQADEYAASRGLKLEEALLKISTENKSEVEPEPLYSAFSDSHPTLYQRVIAIREVQKKLK